MKCRFFLVTALCMGSFMVWSCSRTQQAEEGHGHEHDQEHGHVHENWSVTAWGDLYEVFAECEPLAVGVTAKSHTHVTVLTEFSPLRAGTVSAVLRGAGGQEQVFEAPVPVRDGIFSVEIHPTVAGEFELAFRIDGIAGIETVAAGRVQVGSVDAPGGIIEIPVYTSSGTEIPAADGQPVSFLKEQQWRTPFRTVWAEEGVIRGAVRGPARVRPAAGAEAVLTAPLDGIVDTGSRVYTGLSVKKGAVLLRLAPRAGANQTFAELEAEAEVAKQRLARLEELLRIEAVSRAEVEAARARVATLETQLDAVQGRGGAKTPVVAPFAGEVAEVHVIPGQAVSAGESLVRVVRRTPLWLEVALLPAEAARLSRALAGLVISPSGGAPIEVPAAGVRIVSVAPEVDRETGKVTSIVEVVQPVAVQLGTIVDAELLLDERRTGVVVPATAIVDDAGVSVVYVQGEGESFSRRPIEILGRQAERILVAGLVAGERVVATGGSTIRRQSLMSTGPVEGHVH